MWRVNRVIFNPGSSFGLNPCLLPAEVTHHAEVERTHLRMHPLQTDSDSRC